MNMRTFFGRHNVPATKVEPSKHSTAPGKGRCLIDEYSGLRKRARAIRRKIIWIAMEEKPHTHSSARTI